MLVVVLGGWVGRGVMFEERKKQGRKEKVKQRHRDGSFCCCCCCWFVCLRFVAWAKNYD